jgi:hypothetical protein
MTFWFLASLASAHIAQASNYKGPYVPSVTGGINYGAENVP